MNITIKNIVNVKKYVKDRLENDWVVFYGDDRLIKILTENIYEPSDLIGENSNFELIESYYNSKKYHFYIGKKNKKLQAVDTIKDLPSDHYKKMVAVNIFGLGESQNKNESKQCLILLVQSEGEDINDCIDKVINRIIKGDSDFESIFKPVYHE